MLRRERPEYAAWLAVLEATRGECEEAAWDRVVPRLGAPPAVHGATFAVPRRLLARWQRRLAEAAGRAADDDAARRLERAIALDGDALDQALAAPLLHACRRAAERAPSGAWDRGWCPTCGAWPAFGELRGLERARHLRCGRCATGWAFQTLRCPFCGNDDHRRLGALVPEADAPSRRVETCDACRGWVKSLSTLAALPPERVALEDLATVELDLAALARGLARPERPATEVRARVALA